MPTSLLLAIGVSAGVAAGVFLDPFIINPARWAVAGFGLTAFLLAARGARRAAVWPAYGALAAACVIWGAFAEAQSMRPPLRTLLNDRSGGFDIDAIDTERRETPYVIEGRLTSDAALDPDGASLKVAVDRIWLSECPEYATGGVSLSV